MADAVQPNFGAISQSFNALSTQFGHFQNLPSVREGNQILDAINGFRDDMNRFRDDMNRRFTEVTNRLDGIDNRLDGMDNRLNGMDTRFMATEFNNLARLSNSTVIHDDAPLEPLHRIADNMPIPNFPRTHADIMTLNMATADEVLHALNASTTGTLSEKKRRIKLKVGLRLQTV